MVASKFCLALSLVIFSIFAVEAAHHAAAPSPSSSVDCNSLILNMAECLSFVSSGSKASKPDGACCSGLKTVLKTGPECLCEAFKNSASLGVSLNVTKAMTLPAACKVSAPPSATNCALSPAGAPDMAPTGAPGTFSGGATGAAPALAPGSSGTSVLSASIGPLVSGLIIMLMWV